MSSRSVGHATAALRAVYTRFDPQAHVAKSEALRRLQGAPLRDSGTLPSLYEVLLFLAAHPSDATMRRQIEAEFRRIAAFLKQRRGRHSLQLEGHGLPFVDTVTRFSHDCLRWLLAHADCRVSIDSYPEPRQDLNAVLRLTLPTLERSETTAGLGNDELLDALLVAAPSRLAFIVGELARFDQLPYVKDQLFDSLDLFVRVAPKNARFSKACNRLPMARLFYQRDRLREFEPLGLMNQALPETRRLNVAARSQAATVVKNAMALTSRETDPGTFLDDASLQLFDLERGLTVAVYGMVPERQLPLESYIGFTLFKNGLPTAYGGAWVLGPRSNFGMNIFEPFRGGESGYMMCQVLRVYRQLFGVRFFEVDAHQFGLDNPDGISTGAYWFYYRHGFRSLDAALDGLATRERQSMARRPGYRSSERTLHRFTGCNVALNFGGSEPPCLFDLTTPVTRMVRNRYGGDRLAAERDCVRRFAARVGLPARLSAAENQVLVEVAFLAAALDVSDDARLELLRQMVEAKPTQLSRYQALLTEFLCAPASLSIGRRR